MYSVFKLIHGLHSITVEDAGLSLCNFITRGSGVRLKQGHVINNTICNYLNIVLRSNGIICHRTLYNVLISQVSNVKCLFIYGRTI